MRFFRAPAPEDKDFVDKLTFMLVFMKEHEDSTNIYLSLMDRKKFIFQHLLKARRSEELAARTNMETIDHDRCADTRISISPRRSGPWS